MGGLTQQCEFDKDLYINPGPWRIPYHHHGMMHYAKRLGIALEPFFQVNYNAYIHSSQAFGGSRSASARSSRLSGACRRIVGQGDAAEFP